MIATMWFGLIMGLMYVIFDKMANADLKKALNTHDEELKRSVEDQKRKEKSYRTKMIAERLKKKEKVEIVDEFPEDFGIKPRVIPMKQKLQQAATDDVDSIEDYEYISDGKRMCFINYLTGKRLYYEDPEFHVLMKKMLNG